MSIKNPNLMPKKYSSLIPIKIFRTFQLVIFEEEKNCPIKWILIDRFAPKSFFFYNQLKKTENNKNWCRCDHRVKNTHPVHSSFGDFLTHLLFMTKNKNLSREKMIKRAAKKKQHDEMGVMMPRWKKRCFFSKENFQANSSEKMFTECL